jgi:hypothetical protein
MSCPDWTRPQYGSRGTVVTAQPFARRPFFKGGKLSRHAIALILSWGGAAQRFQRTMQRDANGTLCHLEPVGCLADAAAIERYGSDDFPLLRLQVP